MAVATPDVAGSPLRLAIVGCGAISQLGHAPGALLSRRTRLTTLVDLDIGRACALGEELGVNDCRNTLDGIEKDVDVAIVAVPHRAHLPVGIDLMTRGVDVLIEKPLGCSVTECQALAAAAEANGVVLAVALLRRFVAVNRSVKQIIDDGMLGRPVAFEMFDARQFSWPINTTFLLDPAEPGCGVLIGNGSHMFDLILWWFGPVADVRCSADSRNGAEADATVSLRLESGVKGTLQLSRVRDLGACTRIVFERGTVTVPPFGPDILIETETGPLLSGMPKSYGNAAAPGAGIVELMAMQLEDFAAAVRGEKEPECGAATAAATIELVERCATAITVEREPWWDYRAIPDGMVTATSIPALRRRGQAA